MQTRARENNLELLGLFASRAPGLFRSRSGRLQLTRPATHPFNKLFKIMSRLPHTEYTA